MDDKPRQILQDIVGTYGAGVLSDPRRCKALLMDLCGEYRGEINLLDVALREGIPHELASAVASVPRGLHIARLVQRLKDGYLLPEEAARWAVETCVAAVDPGAVFGAHAQLFHSTVATTVVARAWMSGECSWTDIGLTPGVVALPPDLEVRLIASPDDTGAEKLSGDISTAGGLHQLDLSGSFITDLGLAPLLALDGVTSLDLSRTSVTFSAAALPVDSVPSSLMELKLRETAGLTDAGLMNLAHIDSLEHLELEGCDKITDAGIAYVSALRNLTYLGLSATRISDHVLAAVAELPALRQLDLSATEITGVGLRYLAANPVLEALYLDSCKGLRPEALAALRELSGLIELSLGRCGMVTEQALMYLRPLVGLSDLSLDSLGVSDTGTRYLQDLFALSRLDVARTRIGDGGVARIATLRHLRYLCLSGTRMTDAGLRSLMHLPYLEDLDVSYTRVTDVGLRAIRSMEPLVALNLEGTHIHDAGLVHLDALPGLRLLHLGYTAITDVGLALLGRLTNVEAVDVAMCSGVTEQGIAELAQSGVLVTQ